MGRIIGGAPDVKTDSSQTSIADIISQIGSLGEKASDPDSSYWRSYQGFSNALNLPSFDPKREVENRLAAATPETSEPQKPEDIVPPPEEVEEEDPYREEVFRRLDPSVEALANNDWSAIKDLANSDYIDRRPVEETDADYTELKKFAENPADYLFANGGLLDPDYVPIIGSTDRERRARQEKAEYKQENPTPENAFNDNLTSDEYQRKYEDFFNSQGGVRDTDDYYSNIASSVISQMEADGARDPESYMANVRDSLIPKFTAYDNGDLTDDNVRSKYMSGSQYKKYVEAGFGGRPVDQIEDDATYNKLDEMKDYGFVPYIADEDQRADWDLHQVADSISKAYNMFGDVRDRFTDAQINYNGQKLSRQDFYDGYRNYADTVEPVAKTPDDSSIDYDSDLPVKLTTTIVLDDGSTVQRNNPIIEQMQPDGSVYVAWDTGEDATFDDIGEYNERLKKGYSFSTPEEADFYLSAPPLVYEQFDGTPVELSYKEVNELAESMRNGTADIDWGWGNIAKDQQDRTDIGDMFTSGDFSDFVPNFVDLLLGSAPLFWGPTAWPMAIANGVSSTQGLDARQYDPETGTYRRIADEINPDRYFSNILLSSLVPWTEKLAGGIGGSRSPLWKPMQDFLKKNGVPAPLRYLVDWSGEGLEENVASSWEEYQGNGMKYAFGNPVLDENGNQMYDTSGHALKEAWSPIGDRAINSLEGQDDNFFGGLMLGTAMGLPSAAGNFKNRAGYFADDALRKMQRREEKENDLPRFQQAKRGNESVVITPEDFNTWGLSYDDYMNR